MHSKTKNYLLKCLEIIGKPAFLLFTLITVLVATCLRLITNIIQKVKRQIHESARPKKRKKKAKVSRPSIHVPTPNIRTVALFLSPFIVVGALGAGVYWYVIEDLPHPTSLERLEPSLSTKIVSRDGTLLYKIYGTENRTMVQLRDLPQGLIRATIAAEDKNFYEHHGLDVSGIARAARNNVACQLSGTSCRAALQGGSTITQQLIKNTILNNEKTLRRKLKEAVLALWVEQIYSKEQILEMYLNNIPYGGTSYGVEEAAQEFFGKSARELSLAESALIAGLPVAPTTLSPFGTTPYMAKVRQRQVLERMVLGGYISENEKVIAENSPLALHPRGDGMLAPHFVMYIKSLLVQAFGETAVERGGLIVTTTLELDKQNTLQSSIEKELERLENMQVKNGAGMIISPATGEILAMVGSRDFWDTDNDGQVNVTLQPRQPGSSIKPLTYSLALMSGLSPSTIVEDAPVCFTSQGAPSYCPENYDGRFHGLVTLRTALASSYNIPAVKLLHALGVHSLIELGQKMGITTWDDPTRFGLSLTLGGGEVKMYDLVQAYSVFANHGIKIPLTAILDVRDNSGNQLTIGCQDCKIKTVRAAEDNRVIPEEVAYQISSILADSSARAPAFGTRSILNIPGHTVSVKTGTTNSLRDNWAIGYTQDYVIATWVGNNDNTPMSRVASGITGASPIWASVMQELLKDKPDTPPAPPQSMVRIPICRDDRTYYCKNLCKSPPTYEYFVKNTGPRQDCDSRGTIE